MKVKWHYRGIVLASIGYFMKNIRLSGAVSPKVSVSAPETLIGKPANKKSSPKMEIDEKIYRADR